MRAPHPGPLLVRPLLVMVPGRMRPPVRGAGPMLARSTGLGRFRRGRRILR